MKRFSFRMLALSGVLALPVCGILVAATPMWNHSITSDDEIRVANGTITSVDADRNNFVLAVGEHGEEVTIRFTRRTQFTLDGKESTMEEALKAGHDANVRHRNNVAIQVDAMTKSQPQPHVALAGDEVEVAEGHIKSVDAERNRFVIASVDDEDLTIRVNDRTQYTLDGKESTKEEALKEGHNANVRHRNNLAIRVDATSRSE